MTRIIDLNDASLCCGEHPILDTWDKNEMRSINCDHCGKKTESHFMRIFAYKEWNEITNASNQPK